MGGLREVAAPFVVPGPSGVAIRDSLKGLTAQDEKVLRLVGDLLGSLASRDLKARCAAGLDHDSGQWAQRKRAVTKESSSRWAGSITKATHDQWALARRGQLACIQSIEAGIRTIAHRLALPIGAKGSKGSPGGYRSRQEWFAKSRRLHLLEDRLERERADRDAGRVRVVRGGKKLLRTRHHLEAAHLTEAQWRLRWQAERWFLQADGESGKRYGNETIRITPDGEVSIKLPAPLAGLANAPHGRYVLACRVGFRHRGEQWADRIAANRAVAYRIHFDARRARWYLTASWQLPPVQTVPMEAVRADGLIGVDMNADHLAAWRLDRHGNPVGEPRRFDYDLTGSARHRDAQVRHALIRLLHWARRHDLSLAKARATQAVPPADLRHAHRKTAQQAGVHGRRTRHHPRRRRPRLHQPLGRPALAAAPDHEHPQDHTPRRCRRGDCTARPGMPDPAADGTAPQHQSDAVGHRTVQAAKGIPGREETRPRIPGPRTRSDGAGCGAKAGAQCAHNRSGHAAEHESWHQDSLPLSLQERWPSTRSRPRGTPRSGPGRRAAAVPSHARRGASSDRRTATGRRRHGTAG
ncbi:hypothetical protein STSP_57610 [Streptomyces jeddahensis]|uniref:Transposase n=1 Tax=Streptomyces jeddahensis TaxID=1716141 RepID=A0A177HJT4_9ACTN|nr:hypothetical protein STSP_57610 [Streptomyces jeddahensis]